MTGPREIFRRRREQTAEPAPIVRTLYVQDVGEGYWLAWANERTWARIVRSDRLTAVAALVDYIDQLEPPLIKLANSVGICTFRPDRLELAAPATN